jgi:hypothetical protein
MRHLPCIRWHSLSRLCPYPLIFMFFHNSRTVPSIHVLTDENDCFSVIVHLKFPYSYRKALMGSSLEAFQAG